MPEPIVFISHFRVKAGKLDAVRQLSRQVFGQLEAGKPRTLAFLGYLDEASTRLTFVHLFGDAESMDIHNEGAGGRSSAADELIEPEGWEIYGTPSDAALQMMQGEAAAAGVTLSVEPQSLGGFIRPGR